VFFPAFLRPAGLLACVTLLLPACGPSSAPEVEVPSWAHVAPVQIAAAGKHGVPVAFENELGMRFVLIPPGTFAMGSPKGEEGRWRYETRHGVTISRPFYMSVHEVTNGQFRRFRPRHRTSWNGMEGLDQDDQPVGIWREEDAPAFAMWLSQRDDARTYALPTEAQWEYACRAGTTSRFWSGNEERDLARVGWYFRNSGIRRLPWTTKWNGINVHGEWQCRSHPVGELPPNPWGLHDMHGNVWEQCRDVLTEYGDFPVRDPFRDGSLPLVPTPVGPLAEAPGKGPPGPPPGTGLAPPAASGRVYRGGSWRDQPNLARSASRLGVSDRGYGMPPECGFRLVSPVPETDR